MNDSYRLRARDGHVPYRHSGKGGEDPCTRTAILPWAAGLCPNPVMCCAIPTYCLATPWSYGSSTLWVYKTYGTMLTGYLWHPWTMALGTWCHKDIGTWGYPTHTHNTSLVWIHKKNPRLGKWFQTWK